MTVFDQRGQVVNYQYNAAGDINFDSVESIEDFIRQIEKVRTDLHKARAANIIDVDTTTDVDYQLTKVVQQAQKGKPDKKQLSEHIDNAKKLIEGVSSAAGMVQALMKAAELVQKFF